MALKLLLAFALILMASSCGSASSSGETPATGRPPAVATTLLIPDRTLEANPAEYQAQSACDSPYLPLRKGTTWTYLTRNPRGGTPASEVITVTDLQGDLSQASATVSSQIPLGSGQLQTSVAKYTCDAQGIHLQGPALSSYTLLPELPSVNRLGKGSAWAVSNQKTIQASAPCWGGGTYTRISQYAVRGIEPVDLASAVGGRLSALRIDEVNPISPLATPSNRCVQSTANSWWLAPGLGVVSHNAVVSHLNGSFDYTLVTDLVGENLP